MAVQSTSKANQSRVMHRILGHDYPVAASGKGAIITDAAGKTYIDFSGGAAVSCLGHGHPRVVQAIREQVDRIAFAHSAFFTSDVAEELAEHLIAHAPDGFSNVHFVSGGSEANDAALKLARQYQLERGEGQRDQFVARRQSYHGTTLGTIAVSGHVERRAPFEPILARNVAFGDPCYAFRLQHPGESDDAYGLRAAESIRRAIEEAGPDRVIAVIAETVVGSTLGAVPAVAGYFQHVRRICDDYGALLILDEVMCGAGRCGTLYACEQDGVVPDMITMAKGLGAGYQPIGALLAHERVVNALAEGSGAFRHSHTYMAHPTAAAAALAVQKVVEEDELLPRVRRMGDFVRERLEEAFREHPHVGDIRGRGLFIAAEIVENLETAEPFPPEMKIAGRIKNLGMEEGLVCYPMPGTVDGIKGDHVLLAPPFIISEDDAAEAVTRLRRAVDRAIAAGRAAL